MELKGRYGNPASLDQIEAEIERLSDVDWMKLRKLAQRHLWGTRFAEPDELINETIGRLIQGTRRWSPGMAFIPWLDSAMKSVADGLRKLRSTKTETLVGDMVEDCDDPGALLDIDAHEPSVLEMVITEEASQAAAEALDKIGAYFEGDQDVQWILLGLEEGLKAEEVRELGGMTQVQYETARRRMRRGAERLIPARRKP